MFRKVSCKFFQECIDGNECFFEHQDNEKRKLKVCPDGIQCSDQSCTFSEANHASRGIILCRFQAGCNRINCSYKHVAERKAFLGVGSLNIKGK